jgi:site-specific recombinase XerD
MVEFGASEGAFQEYWERFAAHLERLERRPLTIKNYRSDLKAFAQWLNMSELPLPSLTKVRSQELRQYQTFLVTQQKLKPGSVNRRLGALKNFYNWLQQTEGLTNDRRLSMPAPVKRVSVERVAPLSLAEQQSLLEAVQQDSNQRDLAIIQLLLSTGLRVGELCQLRWAELDLSTEPGSLLVRSIKIKQVRRLMLPPDACAALRALRDQAQADSQATVFVGQRGDMTARGMQDVVRKYALRAGLRNLTPHTLRRTYTRRLMEQGVHPDQIAALTGASAEMLLASYAAVSPILKAPPWGD